jgi:glycosyltransferase involved in cell wall biosynthesis
VTEAPLVSVVLTTNRASPYLQTALESLVAQTYTEWELILVDDGSPEPDAVEAACSSVPGARVIHQANAGISVARNVGIAGSRGTYVAFLDDDDEWSPERLALQVAALQARPDAVAAYGQIDFIDEHGDNVGTAELAPGDLGAFLRNDMSAPIISLMVVRRALDRVGGFHSMFAMSEDIDLIYRLARAGPFVFVPEVLVHYRRHGANMSANMRQSALWSRRALWLQQWWSARAGETELLEDVRIGLRSSRRYWAERMVHEAVEEFRHGHLSAAGELAYFVARHDPVAGLRTLGSLAYGRLSSDGNDPEG